ncbi:ComEC/Rec2 family competence protein [Pleomorphovibrio marinus]|uniref:ComEC/Rec2 family competence protein n=1 Tax=Pleomorphovibrio marinus TaxID=2164132 RepID=UPI001E2FCA46|nr:ComEC/Rec2 family competence protein [Pleomorphovibrio marinus]
MSFAFYGVVLFFNYPAKRHFHRLLLPSLAFLVLCLAGISFSFLRDARNSPNHLIHFSQLEAYMGIIQNFDEPKAKTTANRLEIKMVRSGGEWVEAVGIVLIYHNGEQPLNPGDLVLIKGVPSQISPPVNPHEFDYRMFMEKQQVYHRHFLRDGLELLGRDSEENILRNIMFLRRNLIEHVRSYIPDPLSQQIAQALLLGQKEGMDMELREAYSTAGAMHILAVSGLHVGIIYGFFLLFFKPHKLSLSKRVPYLLLIISGIWFYALLTGMSPSVLRSATMFTFISLAQMRSRSPSIFNPLALSALVLLLYDPFLIYAVGFQLSYAALSGILIFQPFILNLWNPKGRVMDYIWQITSVSIAAQLATFPISSYYFHVFPTYFMLANLVAIPGAFLIMSLGLPFLVSFLFPLISDLFGQLLSGLIQGVNALIFSVNKLPGARISHIHMEWPEMILFWGLLVCLLLAFQEKRKNALKMAAVFSIFLVLWQWYLFFARETGVKTTIYSLNAGAAVDYFFKGQIYSYLEEVTEEEFNYKILPHRIRYGKTQHNSLKGIRGMNNSLLILLPSGETLILEERDYFAL